MIRGNYSLAKEVRKNEQKNKQKLQSRQKLQSKREQLSSADPIKIYLQIERLERVSENDHYQQKRLLRLREDWAFIRKHKLHAEKVDLFLAQRQKLKDAKEKAQRKLLGKDSIYFNPELNPLGKVPQPNRLMGEEPVFPNLAKPLKAPHHHELDPLIREYNITPPEGNPPRFYKLVQNTQRKQKDVSTPESKVEDSISLQKKGNMRYLDSESEEGLLSDDS